MAEFTGKTDKTASVKSFSDRVYLDRLDHFLKEELKAPALVRYMDDFAVWADSKEELFEIWSEARLWLSEEMKLELKESACRIQPVSQGLMYLGMQIFPGTIRLQGKRLRRTRRLIALREKQFASGELTEEALVQCVGSATGLSSLFPFRVNFAYLAGNLDLENGVEAASGSNRVNRGGSWNNNARNCRSANRNRNTPGNRNNNMGFRLLSTAFNREGCPIRSSSSRLAGQKETPCPGRVRGFPNPWNVSGGVPITNVEYPITVSGANNHEHMY